MPLNESMKPANSIDGSKMNCTIWMACIQLRVSV